MPSYEVEVLTGDTAREAAQFLPGNGSGVDAHNPFLARVAAARELHGPTSERSCLHVELDISGSQVGGLLADIRGFVVHMTAWPRRQCIAKQVQPSTCLASAAGV